MPRLAFFAVVALLVLSAQAARGAVGPRVFRGPGIVLRTPNGWYVSNEPLNAITDPVQRFVLSSYRLPTGADAGGGYVPSSRGVIALLDEEVRPLANNGAWRPRPRRFRAPRLGRMETLDGNHWGELLFREYGRHFYIFIWVGQRASSAQIARLLHALDSMSITTV
jgi:hypothetical protein